MKLTLKEYNVTPIKQERNELIIIVSEDGIKINNENINNNVQDKRNQLEEFIKNNNEEIISITKRKASNYKGGHQKMITIVYNGQKFLIIGNTPDAETQELYEKVKETILSIIK